MSWGKALIWGTVIVAVLTCSTSSSCVAALGRYGLKSWIEAAKKRLHHNVLAIAHGVSRRQHKPSGIGVPERVHFTKF